MNDIPDEIREGMRISRDTIFVMHPESRESATTVEQIKIRFTNGYGLSIIQGLGSHGFLEQLFEVGILRFTGDGWLDCYLDYYTKITDDVLTCTYMDIVEVIKKVADL